MFTEKGTFPNGVEYDGKIHKEFELREQLVCDAINVFDDPEISERAQKNPQYLSLCILANMIVRIGDIPKEKITGDLLNTMYQDDLNALRDAEVRLDAKRRSFRAGIKE